jgi:hypothetical protein
MKQPLIHYGAVLLALFFSVHATRVCAVAPFGGGVNSQKPIHPPPTPPPAGDISAALRHLALHRLLVSSAGGGVLLL